MSGDHDGEGRSATPARGAKRLQSESRTRRDRRQSARRGRDDEVKKIFVETSDPINEYRVQIKKV